MSKVVFDNQLFFAKVKPEGKIPSKKDENAGYDIYCCFDEDELIINPSETVMIPTGIASACNIGYYLQLAERGSTGTKGIGQRCGVIDSSYRGEWFVPVTNHNTKSIIITKKTSEDALAVLNKFYIVYPYTKAICQAILLPVPQVEVSEMSYEELCSYISERGSGCLGSSNK